MSRKVLATIFLCWSIPCSNGQAVELEAALAKLENFQVADVRGTLNRCIDVIRAEMPTGDTHIWGRLKRIVERPSTPTRVKVAVWSVATAKADAAIAADMLSLALVWSEDLRSKGTLRGGAGDESTRTSVGLLNRFIPLMSESPWREWIGERPESLRLLQTVIMETGGALELGSAALRALGVSPAPIEQRRAVAEVIVGAQPRGAEPAAVLLSLLDSSSFPKLRELVRQSDDPLQFHYGAAAALAHLGDREVLPDLEARRPAFRAKHVNLEGYLIYYIWQINVQNPPSKLLSYIASTENLLSVETRMWAVRRAVELDIPKEKIREAILEHAGKIEPKTYRQRSGRSVKIWPGLSSLKAEALELGVLRQDDLPHVKVPKVKPTP